MSRSRNGKIKAVIGFGVAGLLFAAPGYANVSLKNGNFFIGYTDIVYPGGFEPKIERVYNSKSAFDGMFGWGWGNEYEVYLTVAADASVVVHEYGGGAENRFDPTAFNAKELDAAVTMIANAARKSGAVGSMSELAEYKHKLKTNASFRNDEWESYLKKGYLKRRVLKPGTQLVSNKFQFQYITKVAGGYIRASDNGRVERFDDGGRLVRVQDKNNNFIQFAYGKDGRLQKLTDNFNRKMFFTFKGRQLVRIDGENGKHAEYQYNSKGELVRSRDVDGNVYTYKYDGAGRHNMVEIGYAKGSKMAISYYGRDKHENVKSVKDPDGTTTAYSYDNDSSDRGHFSIGVNVKGPDGKMISTAKYEYFLKYKANGEEWQYKLITTLDGDRTETTYNECCGLPLLIKHGKDETSFEYDTRGHVTKKITPNEVTMLSYDPKASKVSKVVRYSKLNRKESSWSQFQYDAKGNLKFAKNSEGKGVYLYYDGNGRIRSMVDQNRRQINFKYNDNSKPVQISDPKLGTITVSYNNAGEIKKVESSAGRKVALEVTSAFQNLLEIIRPAGVTLSF